LGGSHRAQAALTAIKQARSAPVQNSDHEFKNFHRLLCERFGYTHDEVDWKRDQISLIEWIAKQVKPTASVPLTEPELRAVLKKTNRMITNAMCGPFWPELEQACRAIEAAHGITGKAQP
jgi:hypothetical protein